MRWEDLRASTNVDDRRGGGGGMIPGGAGGLGIGATIILGLIGWALGIDPRILIGAANQMSGGESSYTREAPTQRGGQRAPQGGSQGTPQDEAGRFAAKVLGSTEDLWKVELPAQFGRDYRPPRLVLFSNATRSGCGAAQSAMGPFYCPLDQTVYLDLAFFRDMPRQLGAGGDFAFAYVIAHEVGHHVENQMGLLERVQGRQREVGQAEANQLSVRVELMADCLAGIWAKSAQQVLEPGDIEEAIKAAEAIGDDRLQRRGQGTVVPDSFTHGTSAQRVRWFTTGFKSGQIRACDTFRASRL